MISYEVVFTDHADRDFIGILDDIAKDKPQRAISFVDELQERIQNLLAVSPRAGKAFDDGYYFPFGNYIVVYDIDDRAGRVVVHMIVRGERDWRV